MTFSFSSLEFHGAVDTVGLLEPNDRTQFRRWAAGGMCVEEKFSECPRLSQKIATAFEHQTTFHLFSALRTGKEVEKQEKPILAGKAQGRRK